MERDVTNKNVTELPLEITAQGLELGLFSNINHNLIHLSISAPHHIQSSELFKLIPKCFPNLRHLTLSKCEGLLDDEIFKIILPGLLQLYTLEIKNNNNITDSGLMGLGRDYNSVITVCDSGCNVENNCVYERFSQQTTIKDIKSLRHLTISGNKSITNLTLSEGIIYQELETLDLSGCSQISEAGLAKVSCGNPSLRLVKLVSCANVTDECIDFILINLQRLTSLEIEGCQLLTGKTFDSVMKYGKKLCFLDVRACPLIENTPVFKSRPYGTKRAEIINRKPLYYLM